MRHIDFYRQWSGRAPVEEFLLSLPAERKDKVVAVLEMIEREASVPVQFFKKLPGTGGLWEARVHHGGAAIRLLGFFDGPRLVILVSGFLKKSRKVPAMEIEVAQARRKEYQRMKGTS
jgi:phage-related protein